MIIGEIEFQEEKAENLYYIGGRVKLTRKMKRYLHYMNNRLWGILLRLLYSTNDPLEYVLSMDFYKNESNYETLWTKCSRCIVRAVAIPTKNDHIYKLDINVMYFFDKIEPSPYDWAAVNEAFLRYATNSMN